MSLGKKAVFWSAGYSLATNGSIFLLNLGLARILGKAIFGEWGIIQNTIAMVAGIAQLSMAVTATKYVAEVRDTKPERIGPLLGVCSAVTTTTGAIAGLGIFLFSEQIATLAFHAPHLKSAIELSTVYLMFFTMNGFQIGVLGGLESFRTMAVLGVVYAVAGTFLPFVLAWFWGLHGAILGVSAAAVLNWSLHYWAIRRFCRDRGIPISYRGLTQELGILGTFAFPATLAGISTSLASWLSNIILVKQTNGYSEMAVLTAANSFKNVVMFAPTILSRVSLPILANRFGNKDDSNYSATFSKSIFYITASALAVALPIAVLAKPLLLLFGKNFDDGIWAVVIFAFVAVFEAVRDGIYQKMLCLGWMWWGFFVYLIRALAIVGLSYALAASHGSSGIAFANLVGAASACFLCWLILKIKTN